MWNSAGWKDSTISSLCAVLASTNELSSGESFTIFPNPIADEAFIKSTVEGNLTLYDVTGREVREQKILPGQILLEHKDVMPGVYFYHLIATKGKGEITGKLLFTK